MRILIVSLVFHPENFIINDLALELNNSGYEVEVMCPQPSYPEGRVYDGYVNSEYSLEIWNGIKIHRFKTTEGYKESKLKKILHYYNYVRRGKKLIGKIADNCDIILIHQPGPLTVALPAVYARHKFKKPTITWTFDIWPDAVYAYGIPRIWPIELFLNRIIRHIYINTDQIWVSSNAFKDTIEKYVSGKPIHYIPNWLVRSECVKSDIIDKSKINFTFTGNISVSQNLNNVIQGFAKANIPNAVLNIVGDGSSLSSHKELVKKEGIKNVIFWGRRPYSHMQDILLCSDYLVLPLISRFGLDKTEPFKIQSYLLSGKPILGIITGAGKDIIEEHDLGICVDPNDIDAIAKGFIGMTQMTSQDIERIKDSSYVLMNTRFSRTLIINNIKLRIDEYKCR